MQNSLPAIPTGSYAFAAREWLRGRAPSPALRRADPRRSRSTCSFPLPLLHAQSVALTTPAFSARCLTQNAFFASRLVLPWPDLMADSPSRCAYSGNASKLSGVTTTAYVPGADEPASRSRSSSFVRTRKGGKSSALIGLSLPLGVDRAVAVQKVRHDILSSGRAHTIPYSMQFR